MDIKIMEITPSLNGEEVMLKIRISDGVRVQSAKGEIAVNLFSNLGIPYELKEPKAIDEELYDRIEYSMKLTDAVKAGLNLLSFAQNTKKALTQKLVIKGFGREIAADAANYLENLGFIKEYDMAVSLIEDMSAGKLYGQLRIKNELFAKGFETQTIDKALEDTEVDYVDICCERIRKNTGIQAFEDKNSAMKAMAQLNRYGFTFEEIKKAVRIVSKEQ